MKRYFLFFLIVINCSLQIFSQHNFLNEDYTYFSGIVEPDPDWILPKFDDNLWIKGNGAIGYGDSIFNPYFDYDSTQLPEGSLSVGDTLLTTIISPTTSLYARYPFTIESDDTIGISGLSLEIYFDDGFIAYLNGAEFARVNMGNPGDPVNHTTLSNRSHESPKAAGDTYPVIGYYINHDFLDQHLNMGENVISVEVHNDSLDGSDLFLECALYSCLRDTVYDPLLFFWSGGDIHTSPRIRTKACIQTDTSTLPIILIESDEFGIPFAHKEVIANMRVIKNAGKFNSPFDTQYDGRISIEVRGNSSSYFPKQSFNIETQLPDGSNNNVSLLGMPAENDWKLIGPISDRSLIRHTLTYELGRKQRYWEPRSKYCELVLNGEYLGLYALTEKIKPDDNRLDIANLNSTEISGDAMTGGYIFWKQTASYFTCYYPNDNKIQPEQYEYINSFIDRYWEMVFSDDFFDSVKGYNNWVNTESMLDYLIINELSFDHDKYAASTYMYKNRSDRDSLIHFGPLWDYNYAYGNTDQTMATDQWRFSLSNGPQFKRYFQDTTLVKRFAEKWHEQRRGFLHNDSIFAIIDSLTANIREARIRDSLVWDAYATVNVYFANDTVYEYDKVIDNLKDWIARRTLWIDTHVDSIFYPLVIYNPDELHEFTEQPSMLVYPNPFTDELHLEMYFDSPGQLHMQLANIQGQVLEDQYQAVEEGMYSGTWKIRKDIPPGLYIMNIRHNGNLVQNIKLMKE